MSVPFVCPWPAHRLLLYRRSVIAPQPLGANKIVAAWKDCIRFWAVRNYPPKHSTPHAKRTGSNISKTIHSNWKPINFAQCVSIALTMHVSVIMVLRCSVQSKWLTIKMFNTNKSVCRLQVAAVQEICQVKRFHTLHCLQRNKCRHITFIEFTSFLMIK